MMEQGNGVDSVQGDHPREGLKLTRIAYILLERQDGAILLSKRNRSRLGDTWGLPAGHIEEGETWFQTTVREAHEELGVILEEKNLEHIHTLHLKDPDGQRVGFVVRAKIWVGEPKNMEPEKCAGIMWVDPNNLPKDTVGHMVSAFSNMKKGIRVTEYDWEHPQEGETKGSGSI